MKKHAYSHIDLMEERYKKENTGKVYGVLLSALQGRLAKARWEDFDENDWADLQEMAGKEGVAGALYWHWKQFASNLKLPPMTAGFLGAHYFRNRERYLQAEITICENIGPAILDTQKIIILLKGVVLASALYPNSGMRPLVDIDCLAAKEDISCIQETLHSIGYTEGEEHSNLEWGGHKEHHIALYSNDPAKLKIELHYSLSGVASEMFSIDTGWFLKNIQPASLRCQQESLWVFNPSAQLLHLCIHLLLDNGEGASDLIHFFDIHLLINKWGNQIHWPGLVNAARKMNLDYALWAAVKGSLERFGTSMPSDLEDIPNGRHIYPVKRYLESRKKQYPRTPIERYLRRLSGLPARKRIAGFFRFLFPKSNYIRSQYRVKPDWLWFLGYFLRLLNGFRQAADITLRKLNRKKSE